MVYNFDLLSSVTNILSNDEENSSNKKIDLKVWLVDFAINYDKSKLYVLAASMVAEEFLKNETPLVTYSIIELKGISLFNMSQHTM
jgi:hypothetical protein